MRFEIETTIDVDITVNDDTRKEFPHFNEGGYENGEYEDLSILVNATVYYDKGSSIEPSHVEIDIDGASYEGKDIDFTVINLTNTLEEEIYDHFINNSFDTMRRIG